MVSAQLCSELGDGITTVALPLYVYARTESPLATSLTLMAELLAGVVLGVVGGVLADGFDRQRAPVASYAGRAAVLVLAWAAGPLWLAVLFGVLARGRRPSSTTRRSTRWCPTHADGLLGPGDGRRGRGHGRPPWCGSRRRSTCPGRGTGCAIAAYGIGVDARADVGRQPHVPPIARRHPRSSRRPSTPSSSVIGVVALVPWLLPIGWLVWGIAMGPEMVIGEMLVVESVPEAARGRAFAAMSVLMMLGMAAGYGVAGPMIEWVGPRATIAWTSVGLLSLVLLWIGPARRPRYPLETTNRSPIRTTSTRVTSGPSDPSAAPEPAGDSSGGQDRQRTARAARSAGTPTRQPIDAYRRALTG